MEIGARVPGGAAFGARLSTLLAVGLACVVLLTLLGHKLLTNWDEAIYAEVSREMLTTGWLVPHWNGQVWLEKPPLMLWITAAFFRVFGVTEFWARAGSAFSGVALVGLLHGWLLRREGQLAAWLCTVILLSTFGFLHVCRVGEMDVLLSLGCCVAVCGLTWVGENKPSGWLLFWSGLAVAAMTKGGASVVLALTAGVLAAAEHWLRHRRFGKEFWLGLVLCVTLVLPWHLAMWLRYRQQFVDEYLGYHVLARAAHPLEGHVSHWWFYLWVLFVSAMPWSLLYPVALWAGIQRRELRAWAIFSLVVLCFFSAVRTRLPHYIAPLYPAMASLTAVYAAEGLKKFVAAQRSLSSWAVWSAVVLVIAVASVSLTSRARGRLHRARDTGGPMIAEDKETVRLLREVFAGSPTVREPVLVWRRDRSSIATSVFYSAHRVQQVQLSFLEANHAGDKYTGDPVRLEDAVRQGPYLLLLEEPLVQQIPSAFHYQEIARGAAMEIGWIERR